MGGQGGGEAYEDEERGEEEVMSKRGFAICHP